MTAQLVLGVFNDTPYHAIEFSPSPRICNETLNRIDTRINLSKGEAGLSIHQLLTLHRADALEAQKRGSGLT